MKIVFTFVEGLYAFKYQNEQFDELERLLDEWTNKEILKNFFEENKKDLEYFSITTENAIEETIKEAEELANYLANLIHNNYIGLDNIFRPLDDLEFREIKLSQQKAKRRWLRLYAIKIETQCYVITGGTIKLTHKNKDREHTQKELLKLKKCKNYFETEGVFDSDSLNDLFDNSKDT